MSWQAIEIDGRSGSRCEWTVGDGCPPSWMDALQDKDGTWSWQASLWVTGNEHFAAGDHCATEGKARFMAMSLVSALLQIIDGVKPHEVD